jgi:hypothetical protein
LEIPNPRLTLRFADNALLLYAIVGKLGALAPKQIAVVVFEPFETVGLGKSKISTSRHTIDSPMQMLNIYRGQIITSLKDLEAGTTRSADPKHNIGYNHRCPKNIKIVAYLILC